MKDIPDPREQSGMKEEEARNPGNITETEQDPAKEETGLDILASAKVAGREYVLAAEPETADDDEREVFVLVKIDGKEEGPYSLYRDATEEEADAVGSMLIGIAEDSMAEDEDV